MSATTRTPEKAPAKAGGEKPMNAKPLTHKQRLFVQAFNGNASATARKIGLNPDYGRQVLSKPHVVAAILTRDAATPESEAVLDRRARQVWWSKVIQDETVPLVLRLRASELLGRSEGDFLVRHEVANRGALLDVLFAHAEDNQREHERIYGQTDETGSGTEWPLRLSNATGEAGRAGESGRISHH